MQFRMGRMGMGNAGPRTGIGCGGLVAVLGLILVSPVGEWLIKAIGVMLLLLGGFIVITGFYYWLRGPRRGGYL
ncbi:MAG: hypothetical protein IH963_04735 [Chloroflexi bacterium]|nr:hypothetical protein [Chloroflexota bacterium]